MSTSDVHLERLRAAVAEAGASAPAVSGWSVGMHVHHCCLSTVGVARLLIKSTPPPPVRWPSAMGRVLLAIGRIPRGRARTIDAVSPREDVAETELRELLDESERLVAEVTRLAAGAWFRHFVFGVLNRDRAIRFLRIHNDHHLRIVADILGATTVRKTH